MDELTLERVGARKVRHVAVVVVVVPGAGNQEPALELLVFAGRFVRRGHKPAAPRAVPVRAHRLETVVDVVLDAVFARRLSDVFANRRTIGQHLERVPGPELVSKAEHVGIGPNAGITEQIPGAAQPLPALDNRKAHARALLGHVASHADTGQAGPDDEYVNSRCLHGVFRLHPCVLTGLHGANPGRELCQNYPERYIARCNVSLTHVSG